MLEQLRVDDLVARLVSVQIEAAIATEEPPQIGGLRHVLSALGFAAADPATGRP